MLPNKSDPPAILYAILEVQSRILLETRSLHRDVIIVGGVYLLTIVAQVCVALLWVRP